MVTQLLKKTILFFFSLFAIAYSNGQALVNPHANKDGRIVGYLTFEPGWTTKKIQNVFFVGGIEYYHDGHLSVKGESLMQLVSNSRLGENAYQGFSIKHKYNYQSFVDFIYHFNIAKAFHPFVMLQSGISFTQLEFTYQSTMRIIVPNSSSNPMMGVGAGFNYFATKYFVFFANLKYVYGVEIPKDLPANSLSEFRGNFGLGFFIDTKKNWGK